MPRGVVQDDKAKQTLAHNLQQAMVDKGISSQSELGRLTGIARHNISLYLNGKSAPTSINLAKIARALDSEPSDLLREKLSADQKQADPHRTEAQLNNDGISLKIDRNVSWDVGMKILHLLDMDRRAAASPG